MGSIYAMQHFKDTFGTGLDGVEVAIITSLYSVYVLSPQPCPPVEETVLTDNTGDPSLLLLWLLPSPTVSAAALPWPPEA